MPKSVFKAAYELLGYSRLGPQIRVALVDALDRLDLRKIVRIEEDEAFFFDDGARGGTYVTKNVASPPVVRPKRRRYRRYRTYRWNWCCRPLKHGSTNWAPRLTA
jgi:hypothetical protein